VVDAGTASEAGKLVGDVDPALRTRDDITITPEKGGVGPLTIALLFDHVIEACLRQVGKLA
jgi:5,10-methylene-tetrahydrofolate dehydrogenase/methenyl tetrahydrofolate cyclohydrolase